MSLLMKRAFSEKELDKSALRERALRGEPAAGGFLKKIDFLRYRISFTNMYFDTSNPKKNRLRRANFTRHRQLFLLLSVLSTWSELRYMLNLKRQIKKRKTSRAKMQRVILYVLDSEKKLRGIDQHHVFEICELVVFISKLNI